MKIEPEPKLRKPRPQKPSIRQACEWIALNDEPLETALDFNAQLVTVLLVADIWHEDPRAVAGVVVGMKEHYIAKGKTK